MPERKPLWGVKGNPLHGREVTIGGVEASTTTATRLAGGRVATASATALAAATTASATATGLTGLVDGADVHAAEAVVEVHALVLLAVAGGLLLVGSLVLERRERARLSATWK